MNTQQLIQGRKSSKIQHGNILTKEQLRGQGDSRPRQVYVKGTGIQRHALGSKAASLTRCTNNMITIEKQTVTF